MQIRVCECTDERVVYGILTVESKTADEVQNEINSIKNRFSEKGFDDWCIYDVFAEFPKDWKWEYFSTETNDYVTI